MRKKLIILTMLILIATINILGGCTNKTIEVKPSPSPTPAIPTPTDKPTPSEPVSPQAPQVDLTKIKPNENGQVMILMYHGIGESEKEWIRTPDNFRKDLTTLYEKGYRLISLKDYLDNNIQVQAGFTPFILTFDDGLQNQFNMIEENGKQKIDPNCAVGILEDFKKKHPDFGQGGSFYVYYPIPFRQKELIKEKYDFLINNGYEIGNHTYTHDSLKKLSPENLQKAIGLNVQNTKKYLPDYEVTTLALPYGEAPKGDDRKYVVSGTYEGQAYNNKGVLLVGSNPAVPPTNIKFDAARLPRIRASEMETGGVGMYDWLSYFDKHPERRYVSDGNAATIAIPEKELSQVNKDGLNGKQLITY